MLKKLGKNIRGFRGKKGLTQQRAANIYGCSLRWWQVLEQGTNVSVIILTKIAKVLGIQNWELLK